MSKAAPRARPQAFHKDSRLRQRGEFSRVFDAGRRVAAPAMALHHVTASRARLGIAVSRKVDPNAVGRNRIKRVLREAFRNWRTQLASADYVVVARAPAAVLSNSMLRSEFRQLLLRAGALPGTSLAGTMRAPCEAAPTSPSKPEPRSG